MSQRVDDALRGRLQRILVVLPVSQKQVDRIVGADRNGLQIDGPFPFLIEFARRVQDSSERFAQFFLLCGRKRSLVFLFIQAELFSVFFQQQRSVPGKKLLQVGQAREVFCCRGRKRQSADGKHPFTGAVEIDGVAFALQFSCKDLFRVVQRPVRCISCGLMLKEHSDFSLNAEKTISSSFCPL